METESKRENENGEGEKRLEGRRKGWRGTEKGEIGKDMGLRREQKKGQETSKGEEKAK